MIISISGVDGTGKSYLVDRLSEHFLSKGKKIKKVEIGEYFILRYPIELVKNLLHKSNKNSQKKSKNPFLVRSQKNPLWQFIIFPVLLDNYLNYLRLKLFSALRYVVICDRFFYDRLVGLQYYGYINPKLFRVYAWLTPSSDIAFLLELDAHLSLAREQKEKHDLNFYKELQIGFTKVKKHFSLIVIDANPLSKEEVFSKVQSYLKKYS